jgi:hypothetical protein
LNEDRNSQEYDCAICEDRKLTKARNCDGKGESARIKVFDEVFDQCPIRAVDPEAMEMHQLIRMCEGGGFGGSGILPSQLIKETIFFFNVRRIIASERARIEEFKKSKKAKKKR